jgi:hypothetical protein
MLSRFGLSRHFSNSINQLPEITKILTGQQWNKSVDDNLVSGWRAATISISLVTLALVARVHVNVLMGLHQLARNGVALPPLAPSQRLN